MTQYRRIMYLERINYNGPDKPSVQSLSACLEDKNKGGIRNMEYFFCDNINNKINRKLITQHGVKESTLLNIINKRKLKGVVGYFIVEAKKEVEKDLDKQLKKYGVEKIVLG